MSSKTTSVIKFTINEKNIYAKIIWSPNVNALFTIQLFDGVATWSGRFSNEFAERYQEAVDESWEEYSSNVRKAVHRESDNYIFDIINDVGDKDSASFKWKRKLKESSKGVTHGGVPIHRDPIPESKDYLIDFLLAENYDLQAEIKEFVSKNDTLTSALERCKKELEAYVDIKTSLESSLYGKFVQLLNAKKKRIQMLEEHLHNFEASSFKNNEVD